MSFWTHVNGAIRFDYVGDRKLIKKKDLGIISTFENWKEETDMPCGSEGSLEYRIIETNPPHNMARQTVVFWGDLRGFENDAELIAYFERIIEGRCIRSGVIHIDGQKKFILLYKSELGHFEVIETPFSKN